jgi:cobalt-zinc-cadmium efflux system outer membrane protein
VSLTGGIGTGHSKRRPFHPAAIGLWPVFVVLLAGLAVSASGGGPQTLPDYPTRAEAGGRGPEASNAGTADLAQDAGLSDYVIYAELNNPGLRAAFDEWKSALERVPQAGSLPDPRFTYTYYVRAVETRVGPQERSFALMQTLPWIGKLRARSTMASREAEAAYERYEAARLRLRYQVTEAYYDYYYLARAIAITENDAALLTDFEEVARTKYKVGTVPYSALMKAEVERGKLDDDLATLRDMRWPAAAKLNDALGRPPDTLVPWPERVVTGDIDLDDAGLEAELGRNNPELRALEITSSREEAAVGLARQGYIPDITLGASVIETGSALNPGTRDSGKDPVMASISINLPIWIGKYRAAEREARARLRASLDRRQDRENRLLSDLKLTVFNFHAAQRKVDLYGESLIPKAQQALTASRRAFAADQADFFDLIEAERTLLEFQLAYERAFADRAQRIAEIEMLTGRDLQAGPGAEPGQTRVDGTGSNGGNVPGPVPGQAR